MIKRKKHLLQDLILLSLSILLAVFITEAGFVHKLVSSLEGFKYLGVIIAGTFFTSVFTTPISITILGEFSQTMPLLSVAFLGGIGAMMGDYVIFRFVEDRMVEDLKYIFSFSKNKRFFSIFHTRLFRFFIPFLGALIIASPLPDEIGITMLGMSKIKNRVFFLISFVFNGLGIYIVGHIARAVTGL